MDHVKDAIERLRMGADMALQAYGEPLRVCYSGGKDSQVLLRLALEAGIEFTAYHSHTTVDAPETVHTVRETFRALENRGVPTVIRYPERTMWQLIVDHRTPPTRRIRYCCKDLKEYETRGCFIATGVRKAESRARSARGVVDVIAKSKDAREHFGDEVFLANDNSENRRLIERCNPKNAMCVNPLIDWTDAQVLDYYRSCEIKNPLYAEGFDRVGCIGCPNAGKHRLEEFRKWPKYRTAYVHAFDKMIQARKERGLRVFSQWTNGEGVMHWWLEDGVISGQMAIDWGDE